MTETNITKNNAKRPFGWLHLTKSLKTIFALAYAGPHLCIAPGRHTLVSATWS